VLRCGRALDYLGRYDELESWFQDARLVDGEMFRALSRAHAGEYEAAKRLAMSFPESRSIVSNSDNSPKYSEPILFELVNWLEVAVLTEDRRAVDELLSALVEAPANSGTIFSILDRHRAAAFALTGDYQAARDQYARALETALSVRFRPEVALAHLELAELLLAHFPEERGEALEHLDVAIGELQQMNMRPMLERALRQKLELQGVETVLPSTSIDAVAIAVQSERPNLQPHTAPDGTVTLLFTDIEGSTGLTVSLGDQRWLEILRAHHGLIRQEVRAHGGFEVKSQGDGFMLAFSSARRALECAVAVQKAVAEQSTDTPIRVRMGLHTGEALRDANDFHGKHVVLAARIADQAQGGEILVSSLLRELTESSGELRFDDGRAVELKGLAGEHRVYRVEWE
jgi:class 3 adenylate cyclase